MARILVVDDARNIRKMVALTLQKAGHEVEEAADGTRGLGLFGDGRSWDLTLVDQRMPPPKGREMVAEARRRDPMARLVMMTAFATTGLAGDVLEAGAVDFLPKPFSTDTLRATVQSALARPRQNAGGFLAPVKSSTSPTIISAFNGFEYWSAAPLFSKLPPGIDISRTFLVRGQGGSLKQCLVVLMPHIGDQVRLETGRDFPQSSFVWEKVCELAVLDFLIRGAVPPALLPVFELSPGQLIALHKLARRPFTDD